MYTCMLFMVVVLNLRESHLNARRETSDSRKVELFRVVNLLTPGRPLGSTGWFENNGRHIKPAQRLS